MKQLNRFDQFVLYYFAGFSPVTISFMVWATLSDFAQKNYTGLGWDIFGWLFIAWVLSLIYIVTKMLFSRKVRDVVMARLAGIKERDEREVVVAGNAAKFSFLSTFALLLFMLVFSISNLSITKQPNIDNGKHGGISIGFGFKAIDDEAVVHETKDGVEHFNYKGFPLTKPLMILIMMFWQIGSYHLISRKELRE